MPPFPLRPWDAPRPRLNPPRADFTFEHQNQCFHARVQNGLLFFVDEARGTDFLFVAGYVSDLETARAAMRVLIRLGEIESDDDLPRAEIQALAMELLLERAGKRGFLMKLGQTEEYANYRVKAKQIVELK